MSSTGQPRAEACSAQVARPGHLAETTAHRCRSPLHTSQSTSSVLVCTPSASIAPACTTYHQLLHLPHVGRQAVNRSHEGVKGRTNFTTHPAPQDGIHSLAEAGVQAQPVLLDAQAELGCCQLYGPGRRVCPVDGVQEGQIRALPCQSATATTQLDNQCNHPYLSITHAI